MRALLQGECQCAEILRLRTYVLSDLLVAFHTHCLECDHSRDVFGEQVVLEIELALLQDDCCPRLLFIGRRGDLCGKALAFALYLNDYAVLGHLLVDQNDLLNSAHHEVASRVVRTLFGFACELFVSHVAEPAVA